MINLVQIDSIILVNNDNLRLTLLGKAPMQISSTKSISQTCADGNMPG